VPGHGALLDLAGLIGLFVPMVDRCLKDGSDSVRSAWAGKMVSGVAVAAMHVSAVARQLGPGVSVAAEWWAAAVAAVGQHDRAIQHELAAVGWQVRPQHEAAGVAEVAAKSAGQIDPDAEVGHVAFAASAASVASVASVAFAAFAACAVAELEWEDIGLGVERAALVEQQVTRNFASASWPRPLPSSSSSSPARLEMVPDSRTVSREQLVWA
jgi:hypothetical protein